MPTQTSPSTFQVAWSTLVAPKLPIVTSVQSTAIEGETSTTNPKYEKLHAVVATLQVSITSMQKEATTLNMEKCPKSVPNEVQPTKYKRPSFTKFDEIGNLLDHVTIFWNQMR